MDYTINVHGQLMELSQPQVMGILNVTPDSFFAGSRKQTEQEIAERANQIVAEGASIIDTYGKLYILFGLMLLAVEWIQRKHEHALQLHEHRLFSRRSIRYALYLFIILLIITFTGKSQAFIYFQF